MDYKSELLKELAELEEEHRELHEIIEDPDSSKNFPEFTFQRLKKRKLLLKDKIKRYKENLFPDSIA